MWCTDALPVVDAANCTHRGSHVLKQYKGAGMQESNDCILSVLRQQGYPAEGAVNVSFPHNQTSLRAGKTNNMRAGGGGGPNDPIP